MAVREEGFLDFMNSSRTIFPTINVVYASQGGTAEEYARNLAREAYRRCISYTFQSISEITLEDLKRPSGLMIFLISTTGDGEMPFSLLSLWNNLLIKTLPPGLLSELQMAIFGLGDSSYEKFNYAAKKFHRRLEQLGAQLLISRMDGDEQHPRGLDGGFVPWLDELFSTIKAPSPNREIRGDPLELIIADDNDYQFKRTLPLQARVEINRRITTPNHFQDVRHVEFHIDDKSFPKYAPGDVAILLPQNPTDEITRLIQLLGWNETVRYKIQFGLQGKEDERPELTKALQQVQIGYGTIFTLRELFREVLDIVRPFSRSALAILAQHVDDTCLDATLHREKLLELASAESYDLYLDYVWRPRRTPRELLEDFPSIRLPINYLFQVFSILRPREFSISSAWVVRPDKISITAALVTHQKKRLASSPPQYGVGSRWLRDLPVGARVTMDVRKGTWPSIPFDDTPLVLIAAGTGIAPMRALIHHYHHGNSHRPIYLFFGCRYVNCDFLYGQEWPEMSNLRVFVLGSRDTVDGHHAHRRHLPLLLKEHTELIRQLVIDQDATMFLAGNSKLPKLIKATLAEIVGEDAVKCRLFIECW